MITSPSTFIGSPPIFLAADVEVAVPMQALLQGAKEQDSLTCAAHYAELAAVLHFPDTSAKELSSDCFVRAYKLWPFDTADEVVEDDPWPLLKCPAATSEVCTFYHSLFWHRLERADLRLHAVRGRACFSVHALPIGGGLARVHHQYLRFLAAAALGAPSQHRCEAPSWLTWCSLRQCEKTVEATDSDSPAL